MAGAEPALTDQKRRFFIEITVGIVSCMLQRSIACANIRNKLALTPFPTFLFVLEFAH